MKNKVNKYIMLVVGLFLSALSYNLFFKPSNIVVGGVSGLAIIFERLFSIDTSIFILVVNIFLIIISFIFLGFKESIRGIIGSLLFPIFVILTDNVTSYINISNVDILMLTIFGAILFGISSGIIFKAGYNSGGTAILSNIYS